ncbi:cytochrome P450 [Biscogniauxia mediterranea]|nr:cytochrome P450 [Biscogniauxia mediterranea]
MATELVLVYTLALGAVLVGALRYLLARKKGLPLPPGPKPLPIVGNVKDLPPPGALEWEHWLKHKDLYGPISSVTVMGTTMIILNSAQAAIDLLDKRSAIYSSRPRMVFVGEMCGWNHFTLPQTYNETLRVHRKQMHSVLGTKAALSRFYPLQEVETHRFLFHVLQKPQDLISHIRAEAGAIILKIAYGYKVDQHNQDPFVALADNALEQFSLASVPGAWLVDTVPALKYLPEWLPGMGFKKTAREWNKTAQAVAEKPMEFVRKQVARGRYEPSYVSPLYEKNPNGQVDPNDEYVVKWSAAALYTGGADTSVSAMSTFFLAMMSHPEVQRRAQEEIDRVVGPDRLPAFGDRENLPYVEAVVKEAFRFHPIAPMGVPHVTTVDDVYDGYLIPKGALVIQNIWWFTHDPSLYPDPSRFDPTRHLGPGACRSPYDYVFGFGRRICPGRLLADSSVWLTIARSLAVFDVVEPERERETDVEASMRFCAGLISHPAPFRAAVRPRSARHEELVREVETLHPWEESSAEELRSLGV